MQQVTKEPQQITKESQDKTTQPHSVAQPVQQVTMKYPKKVEAGKRLAVHNHRKREVKEREE